MATLGALSLFSEALPVFTGLARVIQARDGMVERNSLVEASQQYQEMMHGREVRGKTREESHNWQAYRHAWSILHALYIVPKPDSPRVIA
ncbi:hypothetical protein KIPB_007744 [Kipferlia bialata]|uniref:Uncharacterized protein n=1 Tax=Kipferlia bialata TaxID=797122 RepID=A0A9K3GKX8_9EUKA|nr:hypothetical protein KIPB_007744 [Kipferlia bialata]|eukprot:g7744.t1